MNEVLMIIVVAACGAMGSGGSGCGVSVHHVEFDTMASCVVAREELFRSPPADASYAEREANWQPKREIKCVLK